MVSATAPAFAPPAGGGGDSELPVLSRDGRYVLFASTAHNLVSLATNRPLPALFPAPINVYLRDRLKGSTVLVSVNRDGSGGGDGDSIPIGVSTNGRYALFESTADNLVAGDTNNAADVFVRDLAAGTTILVSVAANGGVGDDASYSSVMTPDGRYVAFASAAENLVPGDTNGIPDVFERDLVGKVTTLISVGAQDRPGSSSGVWSDSPVVTPDGRYVAYYSTASNVVPGVQTVADVYLRNVVAGTTTWISGDALPLLQSQGAASNAVSFSQVLSDDGRFVAYEAIPYPQGAQSPGLVVRYDVQSGHSDLVETNTSTPPSGSFEDTQNLAITPDGRFLAYVANALDRSGATTAIRVWDAQTGSNALASANSSGLVSAGSLSDSPVLDEAGRFVAFVSSATDLVTNPIPGDFHLYLRDLQAGTTSLIDADTNGIGSPIDATVAGAMSADGRFVAFESLDGHIVAADRNHAYDVFVRNVTNATTELVSAHDPALPCLSPDGPSATSTIGSLSADGRLIAFWSEADDVVINDTNGLRDVFVRDRVAGTTFLVSVNTNGVAADGLSTDPGISGDGQTVVFSSLADDLVNGDNNRAQDVFVSALPSGAVQLVSVNTAGTGPGNSDSYSPLLSSNGQFVLFRSKAGNLAPGMTAGIENLFWRDLQSQSTWALTTNGVTSAAMTPDGRWVALITSSVKPSFSTLSDRLYVWDSQSKSIVYSLNGPGFAFVAMSSDGQRLAYATNSSVTFQLVAIDRGLGTNWVIATNSFPSRLAARFSADGRALAYIAGVGTLPSTNQIYLYDFQTGTNVLVSRSANGALPGDASSDSPDISPDGSQVVYRSAADDLVPGDTNGVPDIFLYNRSSGLTTLITTSRFGTGSADNRSLAPFFSPDGSSLLLESWASDLIAGDFNNSSDLFSLALSSGPAPPPFMLTVAPMPAPGLGHRLSWPVLTGKSYRVQFKDHLEDPAWQDLGGTVSITGGQAAFQDGVAGGTRFYRVLAY